MSSVKPILHITGYGPFKDVVENPSDTIAQVVAKQMSQSGKTVTHHETLEVNLDAVTEYFDRLDQLVDRQMAENPEQRVLLVHCGVHRREQSGLLRMEVRGFNELEGQPIDKHLPMDAFQESTFGNEHMVQAVTALLEELNATMDANEKNEGDEQRPQWIVSRDAGRYYCNYALYRSLKIQQRWEGRVFAVFLHVVNPHVVGLDVQIPLVSSLVTGLLKIAMEGG